MGMYFVGIDGGGTSCRARIKDSQGNFLGEAKSGSANIMLGAEIAMASILESITSAAEQGGLTQQDFASMHVGLALQVLSTKHLGKPLCLFLIRLPV